MEGWEGIFQANGKEKRAGVAILIPDDLDLTMKNIERDKEEHYVMIKEVICQKGLAIVNVYAPNIRALSYMKQLLMNLNGDIDDNTIVMGNVNTPLT